MSGIKKKILKIIKDKKDSKRSFWKILLIVKDFLVSYIFYAKSIFYKIKRTLSFFDKIFYKKPTDKKIRIKTIASYDVVPNHLDCFGRFCKKNLTWNNLILTDNKFADYYVIFNYPKGEYYDPKKTIVFQQEPESTRNTWGEWANPSQDRFFYVFDVKNNYCCLGWSLEKNYDWLIHNKIEKTKEISTITSDFYSLPGHKKRLDFISFLDKKIKIDIYGKTSNNPWKLTELMNYKGPLISKDEGLFSYKYTFASENSTEKNYFTEKIIDAIVSECLCFYWGCPNLEQFIDERAFIRIDLDNPILALDIIQNAIKNNEWEKRLPYIKEAKYKILNELQMMPEIEKIIKQNEKNGK